MSATKLDEFRELVGKVPAAEIAETAAVTIDEVEAWIAGLDADAVKAEKAARKGKPAAPVVPAKPKERPVSVIRVIRATAYAVPGKRGLMRLPVPRSIYRGEIARKLAALLRPDEYEILERAD